MGWGGAHGDNSQKAETALGLSIGPSLLVRLSLIAHVRIGIKGFDFVRLKSIQLV